eukprot:3237489-Rhodomonas_salina.1
MTGGARQSEVQRRGGPDTAASASSWLKEMSETWKFPSKRRRGEEGEDSRKCEMRPSKRKTQRPRSLFSIFILGPTPLTPSLHTHRDPSEMGAGASSSKKNLLEPGGSARDPSQREGTHSASEGSASRNSEHKGDGSEQGRPPAYKSEAAIQGGSAGKFAADTPAGPGNAGTAVMIHGRAI